MTQFSRTSFFTKKYTKKFNMGTTSLEKILENEIITDETTRTTVLDHLGIIAAMSVP